MDRAHLIPFCIMMNSLFIAGVDLSLANPEPGYPRYVRYGGWALHVEIRERTVASMTAIDKAYRDKNPRNRQHAKALSSISATRSCTS